MATGIFSNIAGGMQYRVSGLVAGETLRFTVTDAHADAVSDPAPPGTTSTATAPGSGSYQVTYVVPANITEYDFLIQSGGNLTLVNGTKYHLVASMNYVLLDAQNETYVSPPADDHYKAVVGHGDQKFILSAGPVLPAISPADTYVVTSYLVTIYPVTAPGVAIAAGGVWQQSYAAVDGVLNTTEIDCLGEGISGSFPAMPLSNNTNYELIVAARNATGTVATAETFHVSPRETPNAVTVAVAAAGGAQATNLSGPGTASAPNAGTTDNKVEFSITLGETAGPAANEYDFAVIVKLTGGANNAEGLYKRINLSNYTTSDVPSNTNSLLNGKVAATDTAEKLENQLVANGDLGWFVNADGLTTAAPALSILDGTEYSFSAKAINVMTITADAVGSDASNNAAVTPSGLPIKPTFAEISTLVGHETETIRIKLASQPDAGPELANGNNGSELTEYVVMVGAKQRTISVASFEAHADGYYYYDIKADVADTGDNVIALVNGDPYDINLSAHNLNGSTPADEITVTPRTVPASVVLGVAEPAQGDASALGSGELSGSVAGFNTKLQTGGTEVADITYQYQVSTDDFATYPTNAGSVIHDISGVGSTTKTFTGLTNGTQYKMRARAVTNVWENSIIGTGNANDEFGANQGSAGATTAKAVGGAWVDYVGFYTPSVPPTIAVSDGTTLDNIVGNIVKQSHNGLSVSLGGLGAVDPNGLRAGTYLTTDDGANGNTAYALTGIKVTATAKAGTNAGTRVILDGSFNSGQSIPVTPPAVGATGHGVLDYHNYDLSFEALNAVYSQDVTRAITTTSPAHVTNAVLAIPAVTGEVNVGQRQITYEWSVPDWTTDTTAQYPKGTTFDWVRTECAPTKNANGAADGAISYPQDSDADLYTASASGQIDMVAGTTAYTSVQQDLRDGTKYKFKIYANAKAYHTGNSPQGGYSVSFVDIAGKQPYSKPSVSVSGSVIQIKSNGNSLNETIMISAVNSNLAIQDISTAMTNSTSDAAAAAYYPGGNPPFTFFYNGTHFNDELTSTATIGTAGNYLVLSENDAGATIKLEGQLTTWA